MALGVPGQVYISGICLVPKTLCVQMHVLFFSQNKWPNWPCLLRLGSVVYIQNQKFADFIALGWAYLLKSIYAEFVCFSKYAWRACHVCCVLAPVPYTQNRLGDFMAPGVFGRVWNVYIVFENVSIKLHFRSFPKSLTSIWSSKFSFRRCMSVGFLESAILLSYPPKSGSSQFMSVVFSNL